MTVTPTIRPERKKVAAGAAAPAERLAALEERYRHELMGDEERCELRDRILRLRRRLS